MSRRPDLFIIGAAKCGTTSLFNYLKGHPEIYMSPRKEPRYFSPDLMRATAGRKLRHSEDLDRYLALFAGARNAKRLGEATARYIYSQAAPRLIHDFKPFRGMNRKTVSRPRMSPELRRRLEDEFAPDVAHTSELLGRDLAALWWNRQPDTAREGAPAVLAR